MSIEVRAVRNKKELRQFILLPWKIYKGDPYWVPPLISDQFKLFDKKRSTFFEFGEAEYFLAWDGQKPVGRITAHVDFQFEKYRGPDQGKFGFFECINEPAVAGELRHAAEEWLRKRGKKGRYTPTTFTL